MRVVQRGIANNGRVHPSISLRVIAFDSAMGPLSKTLNQLEFTTASREHVTNPLPCTPKPSYTRLRAPLQRAETGVAPSIFGPAKILVDTG